MKLFLEEISERLLSEYPRGMEKVSVVLPSKRSIIFLKNHLSKGIKKPIFLPRFYSIEEFLQHISGLEILDNLSLQFFLYESYSRSPLKHEHSFDDFLNWSNILLQDFNELDKNLIDPETIFSNLKQAKELESWEISDWSFSEKPLTDEQENFSIFFEMMFVWYNDFTKHLIIPVEIKQEFLGLKNEAERMFFIEEFLDSVIRNSSNSKKLPFKNKTLN